MHDLSPFAVLFQHVMHGPARREAFRLTPAALSDLISICTANSAEGHAPFSSEDGKKRLAEIVESYYLSRSHGEAIKLSTTIRFVKAQNLASVMDEAAMATMI